MGRLAVLTGHTVRGHDLAIDDALDVVVVDRHGRDDRHDCEDREDRDDYVPAPWIDHHAHADALVALGCDRVLALSSVGALHDRHPVGTVLVPTDFVSLAAQPDSQFRDARGHTVPRFDPEWRARVLAAWRAHAASPPVDGGVYWQTTGPRFETPAEVRLIAGFADVVGMTLGSECVACTEVGLAYAALAVVDNLANGVGARPLTIDEFESGSSTNRAAFAEVLPAVVADLAR